jgi:hypothetical protein
MLLVVVTICSLLACWPGQQLWREFERRAAMLSTERELKLIVEYERLHPSDWTGIRAPPKDSPSAQVDDP